MLLIATLFLAGVVRQDSLSQEIRRFQEALGEAFGALERAELDDALDIADTVQGQVRELLDSVGSDSPRQRGVLANQGVTADWVAAKCEHGLGRTQQALTRLAKSGAAWTDASWGTRSLALSLQAAILIDLGLPDLAAEPLEQAMALCKPEHEAGQRRNLGAYFDAHVGEIQRCMAIGRPRDALAAIDAAERQVAWEQVASQVGPAQAELRRRELELLRAAIWVELAIEDPRAGATARPLLVDVLAKSGEHPLDRFSARTKLVQLDLIEGALESAERGLRETDEWLSTGVLPSLPEEERAWLATLNAELARLLDRGRAEAKENLWSAFERLREEWRSVERPGGVGFLRYRRARALMIELLIDGPEEETIQTHSRSQEMGVLWRSLDSPEPSLAEIRATLCSEDTGCLVFMTGVDRSLLLAFDARTILRCDDLPGFSWIENRQRQLASALASASQGRQEQSERTAELLAEIPPELASRLFPEAVRKLLERWKRVRIVGRDLLADVPLQILPVIAGRPLGTTHALSDLPSLPVGFALARRRGPKEAREARVVLVAAPRPDPEVVQDFPILGRKTLLPEHVAPLGEFLADRLAGASLGENATAGSVARAGERGNVLHLVAHGILDPSRELRPMLALTPDDLAADGLFTVELARTMQVPDLVFLSACKTADGIARFGDAGASHLGGALLQAGASSVVVSDDDLQLDDALVLARAFYTCLQPGSGVAEAMRAARARLLGESAGVGAWGLAYVYGLGD